ncbi:MAG: UDP-N-acetylmuramoylalanyl-D-glutamyl-2,6-diaminopimelate/D-alanyl-D-alanyl ligase [Firmicutes bacterium]|nr:UDP-N-acetylmuramoylalanyl-D-glutamyl-2,6-diaminopimelate/D-alanyl-D-alanyl ligase [Bacillota bacterium]
MAEFTISEVVAATGGSLAGAACAKPFTGVSTDTRTIKPGNLFIALSGENFDGHNFINQAVAQGAGGVIISKQVTLKSESVAVITVGDTLKALQQLAGFHRQRFTIPVIAITGSNGKTTTKDMIATMLAGDFNVLKTEANYNNDIGLPLTLLKLTPEHQVAVVEMGMRGRGEIKRLAEIARPTVGVITNVGETHLELLGTIENIAAAKGELIEMISPGGTAILNTDIPLVKGMTALTQGKVVLYGLNSGAAVRAVNIQANSQGLKFDCVCPDGQVAVVLEVVGKHNIYNALAAVAVGRELGLNLNKIADDLKKFVAGSMRLHIETKGEYTIINDAYNASPLSMQAAIETLATVAKGRKVAVLGDMLELGEAAVEAHRRIGKKLAAEGVQVVITLGELARNIANVALKDRISVTVACKNHEEAKEALSKLIRPGDTVLLKGSRGMRMEKILEIFKP